MPGTMPLIVAALICNRHKPVNRLYARGLPHNLQRLRLLVGLESRGSFCKLFLASKRSLSLKLALLTSPRNLSRFTRRRAVNFKRFSLRFLTDFFAIINSLLSL